MMWSRHNLYAANYDGLKFQPLTQERVREIAARHIPDGWTAVETKRHNKLKCGEADPNTTQIKVPYLNDALTVYIYLHECCHVHLGHLRAPDQPLHVKEYQAEVAAHTLARMEGLRLPLAITKAAKRYVRDCIAEDEKRGIEIDKRARKWSAQTT